MWRLTRGAGTGNVSSVESPPAGRVDARRAERRDERRAAARESLRSAANRPTRRGAVATVAAAALAVTAFISPWAMAAVLIVAVVFFGLGWLRLLGLPSLRGGPAVIIATGVAAVLLAVLAPDPEYAAIVMAGGIIGAFVHQMMRKDGRPRLVEHVSGVVGGCVSVLCGAGWIHAATIHTSAATAAAIAIALAAVVSASRLPGRSVILLGPIAGAVGGLGTGLVADSLGVVTGALIGAGVGLVCASLHVLLSWLPSSGRKRPATAAALLPVLLVGVPLELVSRLLA